MSRKLSMPLILPRLACLRSFCGRAAPRSPGSPPASRGFRLRLDQPVGDSVDSKGSVGEPGTCADPDARPPIVEPNVEVANASAIAATPCRLPISSRYSGSPSPGSSILPFGDDEPSPASWSVGPPGRSRRVDFRSVPPPPRRRGQRGGSRGRRKLSSGGTTCTVPGLAA